MLFRFLRSLTCYSSETYQAFERIVKDLPTLLNPESYHEPDLGDAGGPVDTDNTPKPNQGSAKPSNRGKNAANGHTSRAASRTRRSIGRNNHEQTNESLAGPKTSCIGLEEKAKTRKLDCPVHKHQVKYDERSPCGGCGRKDMNQIRHHLQSIQHRNFVPSLQRCKDAKII
jgi:hypothetical protein